MSAAATRDRLALWGAGAFGGLCIVLALAGLFDVNLTVAAYDRAFEVLSELAILVSGAVGYYFGRRGAS